MDENPLPDQVGKTRNRRKTGAKVYLGETLT
jgi:hypothetical protein